jgi:hypothetical protein
VLWLVACITNEGMRFSSYLSLIFNETNDTLA